MGKSTNKSLLSQGWRFTYSPGTRYVGMNHSKGGKQSICEMKHPHYMDDLGRLIADLLNDGGNKDVWVRLIKVCKYRDESYADEEVMVCNKLQRDYLGPIIPCSAETCPILEKEVYTDE